MSTGEITMQDQELDKIKQLLEAALAKLEATEPTRALQSDSASSLPLLAEPVVQMSKSSHPGLERFVTLKTESNSPAPRPCFMEPDRECVHSGACEMRGF